MALLGRHEDAFHVPADRKERAGLDIVVAAVRHQRLDRLAGPRERLDLVEDEQAAPRQGRDPQHEEQPPEELVRPRQILRERLLDVAPGVLEVDDGVAGELRLGELLDDEALADAAGAVDQERALGLVALLPLPQGFGDFSAKNHVLSSVSAQRLSPF